MIENLLSYLDLNKTEVKIYLTLLSLKYVPASTLAQHTEIPRTTIKYNCDQLAQKGLIKRINRNNCWFYSPCPPKQLQILLDSKRKELDAQNILLNEVIDELTTTYQQNKITPDIQFFEGPEGIIEMMNDVLRSQQNIYGALHLSSDMHPMIKKFFENTYIPERQKSNIHAWMLFNDNKMTRAYQKQDKKMNRISMLCEEKKFPFESCLHIYGDKVAFYSYQSSLMTGVIIQDSHIKQMQLSLFKMAWKFCQSMKINEKYKSTDLN